MENKMRIFIALVFLLTSVNVHGTVLKVPPVALPTLTSCPSIPEIEQANEACTNGVKKAVAECEGRVAAYNGALPATAAAVAPSGQSAQGETGAAAGQVQGGVNADVVRGCATAVEMCTEPCREAQAVNDRARTNSVSEGGSASSCQTAIERNIGQLTKTIGQCKSSYGAVAALSAGQTGAAAGEVTKSTETANAARGTESESARDKIAEEEAAKKAAEEGGGWKKYAPWVVGAGMLGVGAMALFGNKGSSNNGQQQNQQTSSNNSSSSSQSSTNTGAPCTQEANITDTSCASTFVTQCTADNTSAICKKFANSYCGFADDATSATSGSGAGMTSSNKTTFCRMNVSQRFCASGNTTCATCEYMTQLNKPICKTNLEQNPTLCSAQKTDAQIQSQKSACPTDPVYAENGAGSILQTVSTGSTETPQIPTGSTSNAANPTTPTTGTGSGVFTGKYYSSNTSAGAMTAASAKRGVAGYTGSTGISSGGFSIATASTYKGAESEITATMGKNLFDKNSKMLQQWCYSVQCRSVRATQN